MKTYATRLEMVGDLLPGGVGAEVGVQRGEFAAEMLTAPVRKLYLVDCWKHIADPRDPANIDQGGHDANYEFVVNRFIREIAEGRVVVHRMLSKAAAARLHNLDFVYIDATHTFEGAFDDLVFWSCALKHGGVIMGHDYVDNDKSRAMGFEVVRAVDEFCRRTGWQITALTDEEWPSFKLEKK